MVQIRIQVRVRLSPSSDRHQRRGARNLLLLLLLLLLLQPRAGRDRSLRGSAIITTAGRTQQCPRPSPMALLLALVSISAARTIVAVVEGGHRPLELRAMDLALPVAAARASMVQVGPPQHCGNNSTRSRTCQR